MTKCFYIYKVNVNLISYYYWSLSLICHVSKQFQPEPHICFHIVHAFCPQQQSFGISFQSQSNSYLFLLPPHFPHSLSSPCSLFPSPFGRKQIVDNKIQGAGISGAAEKTYLQHIFLSLNHHECYKNQAMLVNSQVIHQ